MFIDVRGCVLMVIDVPVKIPVRSCLPMLTQRILDTSSETSEGTMPSLSRADVAQQCLEQSPLCGIWQLRYLKRDVEEYRIRTRKHVPHGTEKQAPKQEDAVQEDAA